MNRILILLIGVLIISCNQNKKEISNTNKTSTELTEIKENFDWLIGKWKRNNEEVGKETFENWQKISDNQYIGLGFTMQNKDTIKQEKIKLIKTNNIWNLEVKVPEESEATVFLITSHNSTEFICENKEIDFPNKIKYWKNGKKINASVSGGEMEILFEFESLK